MSHLVAPQRIFRLLIEKNVMFIYCDILGKSFSKAHEESGHIAWYNELLSDFLAIVGAILLLTVMGTLLVMALAKIELQRISLGALMRAQATPSFRLMELL